MFIMLSSYICLYILTTLLTFCVGVDEVDSLEDISNNIELRFNSIPPFEIADIKFWDDLYVTLTNINISIIYLGYKQVNEFDPGITYYDFYVNFMYDMKFKQLADSVRGTLLNEVAFAKDKCVAFIHFPTFIIRKHFVDHTSLEIDDTYEHDKVIVDSDINDYAFYDAFVKDETKFNVIKNALFEAYLQKFRNVLLFYPPCKFLVMFDNMNKELRRNVVVNYGIKECDEFKEIKFLSVDYDTIIKREGVALNITKVNYNVNYKTSIHERQAFTYFTYIEIGYGRHIQFGDVYPLREENSCINDAVQLLIRKAFEKIYNS